MVFEALDRLGSRADRILVFPEQWDTDIDGTADRDSQLLVKARDWYNVKLAPVNIPVTRDGAQDEESWNATFTKFMAWKMVQYEKVLHVDSDVNILQHLDELFLLPRAAVAMTRAYPSLPETRKLTPLLILLEPSVEEYQRLITSTRDDVRQGDISDGEILNHFYGDSAMVLPHQQYGLLSSEFRKEEHKKYIGNPFDQWDPKRALREASLVFFSDDPIPKPWIMWPHALVAEKHPKCRGEDCRDKDMWMSLYDDFRKRRKVMNALYKKYPLVLSSCLPKQDVCALLSAPAPEWPPRKKKNTTMTAEAAAKAAVGGNSHVALLDSEPT